MFRIAHLADNIESYRLIEEGDRRFLKSFSNQESLPLSDPNLPEFIVKRFSDFPELLGYQNYRCYEIVTIFINSMVNLVFNLTNLTYVFKLLVVMFPMPLIIIKLFTFVIYSAVIVLVIEPEKLRWMTTITMTTFMTISKQTIRN